MAARHAVARNADQTLWAADDAGDRRDNPHRLLWASVILQAMRDALLDRPGKLYNSHTLRAREAREWITEPNEDFAYVCGLAGADPREVRRAFLSGDVEKALHG